MTTSSSARPFADAGWHREGQSLVREFEFREFSDAIALLDRVAACAEDYQRRPDMCILDFNRVRLTISNPHHAGLTEAEHRLAAKVDVVFTTQKGSA